MTQDMIATPHSDQRSENNKIMTRLAVTLLLMMTVGVGEMWGQTTYTYYALHANGKGYMKQRHAAVANDGTFRYENVYDGNGYSIWVYYSSEGYLTNDMYYLCEANGTLILSDKPSTKWDLVTDGDKTRLQKQGTTKIVGLNSGGTPVLDEPENLSNKYAVCEMTIEENNNKWEGPKDVSYTVRSPQLVTFMRVYYIHNITATILKNDAGKINQKVVDKKDSRIFQRLKFKSTTDTNRGTSWDIDETNAVIYNKQASGDVSVTATYTLTSCDPIAAGNHPAVDANVTLKIQPAVLTPDPDKNYLLFYIKDANYRFPYDNNEMSVDDPVAPNATKSVLSDPVPTDDLNKQIAWVIEADNEGFVSFKNAETGRYLYYDATDYTYGSNYGVVKVGETTLPASDNRYKFRLYQPKNHDTYGVCQTIIPYDLQFVVGRSDGDNGIINDGICCAWNVYKNNNIISLWKGNGDSKWKIYAYEAENRLRSDWTINGPNSASETGTYNLTATANYSRNIVGSPANNRDLEIAKTYTKLPVKYNWTVSGINSYITTTNNSSNGDGKLAVEVNSVPVSNTLGTVKCEAYVDAGTYILTVDGVEREFFVAEKVANDKSVAFNLYSLSTEPSNFTEISSLSQITGASGYYKLTADCSDNVPAEITEFTGWLDGNNHTVSGLSAPLFAKMSGSSVVRNLNLKDVSISASGKVGAICAEAAGNARIYNVGILSGNVGSSDDYCGGLVGLLDGSARVINCFSYANITGGTYVGGIVGYNNYATTSVNMMTMVMNCMFYGDISGGTNKAPIYNGQLITNVSTGTGDKNKGVSNFNYFCAEASYVQNRHIDTYNCALMAEKRFLERFEFFRHLLNSHRELAAWWATGAAASKDMMAKWVLEPSQIGTSTPYPILKAPKDENGNYIQYPSVVNIDAKNATTQTERNKGGKLGTLKVNIQMGDGALFQKPEGAEIKTSSLTLNITDKDPEHFNFNYYKVQLPYYNDVGTMNYTGNRVVTGWKIVSVDDGGTEGSFTTGDDATANAEGEITATPYNFADRKSYAKDLYSKSGRIFNQGAYWDVPEGVKEITIEPYWAKAVYLADAYADVVYSADMKTAYNVPTVGGGQVYVNGVSTFNGQKVYTLLTGTGGAIDSNVLGADGSNTSHTVYDFAVVLVGNFHYYGSIEANKPYTVTTVDLNGDNEPDYSFILRFDGRNALHPVRYDFLNLVGLGMAQKSTGGTGTYNFGIFVPKGWFESTNTSLFQFTQFEYEHSSRPTTAPLILQGGVMEQWVSFSQNGISQNIPYYHVGGNVWFKEFHRGTHQDKQQNTKHPPISVTGGDFKEFYLTGLYRADFDNYNDNLECYINGGHFGIVAGAAQEGAGKASDHTNGNVIWQIQNADIDEFYGGGLNAVHPVEGNITTVIEGGYIKKFCGGPKFGDMNTGKTVKTTATNCKFDTYFGAGFGGNSYSRFTPSNINNINGDYGETNWNKWLNDNYKQEYNATYKGVSTTFTTQYIPMSNNYQNVARLLIDFVSFSLATTHEVTSKLTGCTITGNFYGGGSLGKVAGSVTSTLDGCIVNGNVFGAGYSASTPTVDVMNTGGFVKAPYFDSNLGVYMDAKFPATVEYKWQQRTDGKTVNSTDLAIDKTNHILYTNEDLTTLGTVTGNVTLNIIGDDTHIKGDVYGGGAKAKSNADYYKETDPDTNVNTIINLLGGTIDGNAYGGGLGYLGKKKASNPNEYEENPVAADVGNTLLNLNGVDYSADKKTLYEGWGLSHANDTDPYTVPNASKGCVVKGSIFGCNNLNGTPKGSATVHIYKTQNAAKSKINEKIGIDAMSSTVESGTDLDKLDYWIAQAEKNGVDKATIDAAKNVYNQGSGASASDITAQIASLTTATKASAASHQYDVAAVYGGGNLAAYEPTKATNNITTDDSEAFAEVIIDGCDLTSIQQVYGGGNAASTPATKVTVNGTYEIEELFGGGNGKDAISKDGGKTWLANPGANVGFKDYSDVEDTYNTKEKRTEGESGTAFKAQYVYGSGKAAVNIFGGKIHRVFGGSNTKGNVRQTAVTMLDERSSCDFVVDEAYGGGKSAPMDAEAKLLMACIPGLKQAYGGAEAADIQGNVELTITNGTFDRVFGGNNESGTIRGSITVNIEEVGCKPIIIGELYGGGNLAGYSVYGYKEINEGTETEPKMVWKPRESAADSPAGITLATENTPYADPQVNVKSFTSIGNIYGGGYGTSAVMVGNPTVEINEVEGEHASSADAVLGEDYTTPSGYPVPPHASGAIGAINNVFGGGNAAAVKGNTTVKIGTRETWTVTAPKKDINGKTLYEDDGVTPQTEVKEKDVVGANIVGNVYGGGNEAEVTGNTNVQIGKKM